MNTESTFPSTKAEALTMLYLTQRDLSRLSPEALVDAYSDAFKRIEKQIEKTDAKPARYSMDLV